MKIFNIIMNRKQGGVEQASLDYARALTSEDHQVINITSSFARINEQLRHDHRHDFLRVNKESLTNHIKLPNLFPWCIISKIYLKLLILIHKPDLIIAHGGRAVNFSCSLGNHLVPVVGVTHSYSIKHILKCDYIIALDEALKNHFASHGYRESKIFIVPNMVHVDRHCQEAESRLGNPMNHDLPNQASIPLEMTLIGAMGRLVPEKGFNYLIEAISILKKKNYNVKLKLGGSGPLESELRKLVAALELQENVEFIGWVGEKDPNEGTKELRPSSDLNHKKNTQPPLETSYVRMTNAISSTYPRDKKTDFFQSLDIFCVPSTFETFGIVAIESMSHNITTIVTNIGGLKIIVEHQLDGLVVEAASSQALADEIAWLIDNPEMALILRQNAYQKILSTYDINVVKKNLSQTLEKIARTSGVKNKKR